MLDPAFVRERLDEVRQGLRNRGLDPETELKPFLDLDAAWRVNDDLRIKMLASTTRGVGTTARDQGTTWARYGTGIGYRLNGVENAPNTIDVPGDCF